MFFFLSRLIGVLVLKTSKKYDFINDIIFEAHKYKTFKTIVSFIYGLLLGLLLYKFALYPTELSFFRSTLVAGTCCLVFAVSSSCSVKFRVVSVLIWLEIFGKASRKFIKALVIASIIVGPLNNIILNSKELVRVIECTTYLHFNLSKTKFDLAVKPFTNAFSNIEQEIKDVTSSFHKVQEVVVPILNEIKNDDVHQKLV